MIEYNVPCVITFNDSLQLVAVVEQNLDEDHYLLITPLRVDRDYSATENGVMESFSLVPWIPFSDEIAFPVEQHHILNISILGDAYVNDYHSIVSKIFYPERPKTDAAEKRSHSDDMLDTILEYKQAIDDNKVN
jgi:hypothetical protein